MNDVNLEICRQIKQGIDAAREKGVWCSYPIGVWINDQCHVWPFTDGAVQAPIKSFAHAMATFDGGGERG